MDQEKVEDFVSLLDRHQAIVHKVSKVYAKSEEDREDLFQEILYQLWKAYPAFRGESKFSTWMYRIALNTAITGLRKIRSRPPQQELDETDENSIGVADHPADEDRVEILYRAIRTLAEVDRALVMLYLEDMSYDEMADALGLTKTNVGVKLNRIRTRLEKKMREYGA
jgi:RNA polymerase sigma-70 factor (ECF subfamily)